MENQKEQEDFAEGRIRYEMDVDRMVNEGLGGGRVTMDNGFIGDTTFDDTDGADAEHAANEEEKRP